MNRPARVRNLGYGLFALAILSPLFSSIPMWGLGRMSSSSIPGRDQENLHVVLVPGNVPWTDTGLDVVSGQEISFEAEGKISLQKGNPEAECGPDGYDLQTVQQPMPERNLGALIGKVVISVTIALDEKTRKEKRYEVAELFFVGAKSRVEIPAKGRLFLGINENVIGDNTGEYIIKIHLNKASGPAPFQD